MDNTFEQMIFDDLDNVFFSDFAKMSHIRFQDGSEKEIRIVVDDDQLKELKGKSPYDEELSEAVLFFFVRGVDFGTEPAIGSFLWIDGKHYRVVDFNGYSDGMFEIICGAAV